MAFCERHESELVFALELRGFLRPTLTRGVDESPLQAARQLIVTHATNLAGRAALRMIQERRCPICFVNTNPSHVNCDDWVNLAAEEVLAQDQAVLSLVNR